MLPLRMGALQNPPNRQGSNLIFGTYLLEHRLSPSLPPPAATNRGWSNTTGVVR
jgi:hypothetical protein